MSHEKWDLLKVLKAELEFLEKGRYRNQSWRPNFIFEDSPTCLNYKDPLRTKPCSQCVLMPFVPREKREEHAPCRFIPLNALGTTVERLYHTATQDELEAEVRSWLKAKIAALESNELTAEPGDELHKERTEKACA